MDADGCAFFLAASVLYYAYPALEPRRGRYTDKRAFGVILLPRVSDRFTPNRRAETFGPDCLNALSCLSI